MMDDIRQEKEFDLCTTSFSDCPKQSNAEETLHQNTIIAKPLIKLCTETLSLR